jgi:hypothetical protein
VFLTLRHRWRWHERVEHISWSDCSHVCTIWYIISASEFAFCSLAIPRGRLPICIFQLQFIGLIWEIAARWIWLSTYDMGNKLRALLRLVDQLFDSDSYPVGQGTSRQRWPFPARTFPELRESVEKRRLESLQARRKNTFSLGSSSLGNYSG